MDLELCPVAQNETMEIRWFPIFGDHGISSIINAAKASKVQVNSRVASLFEWWYCDWHSHHDVLQASNKGGAQKNGGKKKSDSTQQKGGGGKDSKSKKGKRKRTKGQTKHQVCLVL